MLHTTKVPSALSMSALWPLSSTQSPATSTSSSNFLPNARCSSNYNPIRHKAKQYHIHFYRAWSKGTTKSAPKQQSTINLQFVSEVEPAKRKLIKRHPNFVRTKQEQAAPVLAQQPISTDKPKQAKASMPVKKFTRKVVFLAEAADLFTTAPYFMGRFLTHGQEIHIAAIPTQEVTSSDSRWPNPRKTGMNCLHFKQYHNSLSNRNENIWTRPGFQGTSS